MAPHDCELDLTVEELEYFLETGEEPRDLDKAFETMLELAKKKGTAVCIFTVYVDKVAEQESDDVSA